MDSITLTDFFKNLAGMPDDQVRTARDNIVLERVIMQSGVQAFVGQLMEALDRFAPACSSPAKSMFLRTAVRAGLIKAAGYAEHDNPGPGEPRRSYDRDFPLALALAEKYRAVCPVDPEAASMLAQMRFRFSEFRPG